MKFVNVSGDWNVRSLCCFWHLECWLHCDWTSYMCASLLWSTANAGSLSYCSGVPICLYLWLFSLLLGCESILHCVWILIMLLLEKAQFLIVLLLVECYHSKYFSCLSYFVCEMFIYFIIFFTLWIATLTIDFPHLSFRTRILLYLIVYLLTLLIFCVNALRRCGWS